MQIREKRQSVVIYRAKPILSCFFIPNHGKIVCVAVFIQKKAVEFQYHCQILSDILKACYALYQFNCIPHLLRRLHLRNRLSKTAPPEAAVKSFKRNENFILL